MANNEILEDLFFIERGYLSGNHFVYRSKDPILIDTGYISGFHQTEKLISGLGVNLSEVSLIISTHTHCDHNLMETHWFKETVDLYFNSEYSAKYTEIMNTFFKKGIIKQKNGDLFTTVKL